MNMQYATIVERSIEIVKTNKWLWVFGALVGGGFSSSSGGRSTGEIKKIFDGIGKVQKPAGWDEIHGRTLDVLGEYTNIFSDWFNSIPYWKWQLFLLPFLLTIAVSFIALFILRAWAKASLIEGTQRELAGLKADFGETSKKGRELILSLIIYSMISSGMFILFYLISAGIYLLSKQIILFGIFFIPAFFAFIFLSMISIYAERLIVLHNYIPWEAWKKGLSLSKGKFIETAIMGIINSICSFSFGCLSNIVLLIFLGIPAFFVFYPSIKNNSWPGTGAIIFLIILFILFAVAEILIGAVVNVLKFSNWNQIFNQIMQDEK